MSTVQVKRQAKMDVPVFSESDPELQVGTKKAPAVDDKGNKLYEDPIDVPYLHFLEVLKSQGVYTLVNDEEAADALDQMGKDTKHPVLNKLSRIEMMDYLDSKEINYERTASSAALLSLCQKTVKP